MHKTITYIILIYTISTCFAYYKEILKKYAELAQKLTQADANTPTLVSRHTFLLDCTGAETLISTITALFPALSHSTGGSMIYGLGFQLVTYNISMWWMEWSLQQPTDNWFLYWQTATPQNQSASMSLQGSQRTALQHHRQSPLL